jgi:hypothetical protein
MIKIPKTHAWLATAALFLLGAAQPALAQLSITQNSATDWQISNGAITVDWDSNQGNIWKVVLAGHTDNLVDTTQTTGDGTYKGLYMDNSGVGSGTVTASYHLLSGHYLDWWITTASSSTNAFTYTQHFVVFPNDPGIHAYIVFAHSATDIAGSLGQVQYVFRISQTLFTNTYSYNSGLNNLGATQIPLPTPATPIPDARSRTPSSMSMACRCRPASTGSSTPSTTTPAPSTSTSCMASTAARTARGRSSPASSPWWAARASRT